MCVRLFSVFSVGIAVFLLQFFGINAPTAKAGVSDVVPMLSSSGGYYRAGGASLKGADCSGLVSVAQSIAMGAPPRRLGSTRTLLAGRWPHAIPGASRDNTFVIGVNGGHMAAKVNGVRIEARSSGEPFLIGPAAASPWDSQFTAQYHIDESVLR